MFTASVQDNIETDDEDEDTEDDADEVRMHCHSVECDTTSRRAMQESTQLVQEEDSDNSELESTASVHPEDSCEVT